MKVQNPLLSIAEWLPESVRFEQPDAAQLKEMETRFAGMTTFPTTIAAWQSLWQNWYGLALNAIPIDGLGLVHHVEWNEKHVFVAEPSTENTKALRKYLQQQNITKYTFLHTISEEELALQRVENDTNNQIEKTIHLFLKDFVQQTNENDTAFAKRITALAHAFAPRTIWHYETHIIQNFENEFLYILGFSKEKHRCSLYGQTAFALAQETLPRDYAKLAAPFGSNTAARTTGVTQWLSTIWAVRFVFLKQIETQLLRYHANDAARNRFRFLHTNWTVKTGEGANQKTLHADSFAFWAAFMQEVLHTPVAQRKAVWQAQFSVVPYLDTAIFEQTAIEQATITLANLSDAMELPLHANSLIDTAIADYYTENTMKNEKITTKTEQVIEENVLESDFEGNIDENIDEDNEIQHDFEEYEEFYGDYDEIYEKNTKSNGTVTDKVSVYSTKNNFYTQKNSESTENDVENNVENDETNNFEENFKESINENFEENFEENDQIQDNNTSTNTPEKAQKTNFISYFLRLCAKIDATNTPKTVDWCALPNAYQLPVTVLTECVERLSAAVGGTYLSAAAANEFYHSLTTEQPIYLPISGSGRLLNAVLLHQLSQTNLILRATEQSKQPPHYWFENDAISVILKDGTAMQYAILTQNGLRKLPTCQRIQEAIFDAIHLVATEKISYSNELPHLNWLTLWHIYAFGLQFVPYKQGNNTQMEAFPRFDTPSQLGNMLYDRRLTEDETQHNTRTHQKIQKLKKIHYETFGMPTLLPTHHTEKDETRLLEEIQNLKNNLIQIPEQLPIPVLFFPKNDTHIVVMPPADTPVFTQSNTQSTAFLDSVYADKTTEWKYLQHLIGRSDIKTATILMPAQHFKAQKWANFQRLATANNKQLFCRNAINTNKTVILEVFEKTFEKSS